jgi:hypothetical protein
MDVLGSRWMECADPDQDQDQAVETFDLTRGLEVMETVRIALSERPV